MDQLELGALRYRKGDFSLEASLRLEKGTTGVILGPSGCGKTSLLRCIAGLEAPESGIISIAGRRVDGLPPEARKTGFMFQDLALFEHMTGRRNIEYGLNLRKVDKERKARIVENLAKTLRMENLLDRMPQSMSGGERQRLAFARAIATTPELLLMDEPLSSLDAPLRRELRLFLRTMLKSAEGITALHVTHDVEEALELADTLFIMNSGRILARGAPEELYGNPPDAWCVRFLGLGSLLPLEGFEIRQDTVYARTQAGVLSCPVARCRVGTSGKASGKAWFFAPTAAVTPLLPAENPRMAACPRENILCGTIDSSVFQGAFRRLSVKLMGKSSDDNPVLTVEAPLEPMLPRGTDIRLSFDSALCSILPESALQTDSVSAGKV
jgi:ABC-type Fe3+/spermidine/putrescine transport system ATPase subunit